MNSDSPLRLRRYLALAGTLAAAAAWIAHSDATPQPDPITFENIAQSAGVSFILQNSASPQKRQIEPMVSGVAIFDYNNDGKPDLYFVNGARQPQLDKPDPSFYNRLFPQQRRWNVHGCHALRRSPRRGLRDGRRRRGLRQ